jgi:hypothetical protein
VNWLLREARPGSIGHAHPPPAVRHRRGAPGDRPRPAPTWVRAGDRGRAASLAAGNPWMRSPVRITPGMPARENVVIRRAPPCRGSQHARLLRAQPGWDRRHRVLFHRDILRVQAARARVRVHAITRADQRTPSPAATTSPAPSFPMTCGTRSGASSRPIGHPGPDADPGGVQPHENPVSPWPRSEASQGEAPRALRTDRRLPHSSAREPWHGAPPDSRPQRRVFLLVASFLFQRAAGRIRLDEPGSRSQITASTLFPSGSNANAA